MSSAENDLTQGLLAECRRKDELLKVYKEKIEILENLIQVKEERTKILEEHIEALRKFIRNSLDQTDRVIKISQNFFK